MAFRISTGTDPVRSIAASRNKRLTTLRLTTLSARSSTLLTATDRRLRNLYSHTMWAWVSVLDVSERPVEISQCPALQSHVVARGQGTRAILSPSFGF